MIRCAICESIVIFAPEAVTEDDQFVVSTHCSCLGDPIIRAESYLIENWNISSVNAERYRSITDYLDKALTCDTGCLDCPEQKMCYTGFFYEIDKDDLRSEYES